MDKKLYLQIIFFTKYSGDYFNLYIAFFNKKVFDLCFFSKISAETSIIGSNDENENLFLIT